MLLLQLSKPRRNLYSVSNLYLLVVVELARYARSVQVEIKRDLHVICRVHLGRSVADRSQPEACGGSATEETTIHRTTM